MKILVLPHDPSPYQALLYGEMRRLGVETLYLGQLTRSRTLNLFLLPAEVAVRRAAGARLIHLHWVFAFGLPGAGIFPFMRRIAHAWFLLWLWVCRSLGMHLIWTVHNILPHTPVFDNDIAARRSLVEASDLVLAHSQSALAELAAIGATARKSAIIPHGPIAPTETETPLETQRTGDKSRRFLFFGRVQEYKGVDDLLAAFIAMPRDVDAHLTIAGECNDPGLRSRLHELAQRRAQRVVLRLEHVPESEVAQVLADADVVVLPFRRVTTSGSAMLALSHGKPLVVPDRPALADLPVQAVLRYDGQVSALTETMTYLASADNEILAAMSDAAYGYAANITWHEIAKRTIAEMMSVLGDTMTATPRDRPAVAP